jgi:Protein of unknown function (DUF2783)
VTLDTSSRFPDPDAAYRAIVEAHRGLGEEESRRLDAALILILANALGDLATLKEALALARQAVAPTGATDDRPVP